uniref:Uncharacterized protein n=1 Tax=Aegilops tauschii subsp. strangulata TaxID=200361 RepID=A0A453G1J7_AEGTS
MKKNGRHPRPPPAPLRRRRARRRRLPRRPRPARLHRPMVRRHVRPRCGDRGAVRVPRGVGQPHQLPHGAAGGVHGRRRRGDQRVERRGHDAAAAGGLRRRRLARQIPHHRARLRPLRREHGHADPVLGAPGVPLGRVHQLHLALGRVLAVAGAGDHLLRLALPGGAGGGRAQALRAGVRGRPVRPAPPRGVRLPELLLQLVVLRHVLRHRRHHHGLQLHPGQHRLGPRLRHPLPRHGPRARHVPARHPPLPLLHLHPVQPLRPPRQGLRRAPQRLQVHSTLAGEDGEFNAEHREEVRGLLRLFPIWATCIIYAVIFSQSSTFFTKQAATLDRRIGATFRVPPAALQTFISLTIITFIPVYDRLFVPAARRFTRLSSGITMLQRIGTGLVLALVAMVVAALVEARRLGVARDAGLVDDPKAALPMSLWWMVPQYVLFGLSDVFAMIGLQEFFYDQVPDALRSLGLAFFLSIFGVGHFLSSFLISAIDGATKKGGASWFSNNLNRAHLDYFYWLLAGLCAAELAAFVVVSRVYVYKKRVAHHDHGL